MMTPDEFRAQWADDSDELVTFPPEALAGVRISTDATSFLREAGLPDSCAPFLNFQAPARGPLPVVSEEWNLPSEFARYRQIGFNEAGDPLCIDETAAGAVVVLNHDDAFRRTLVNSTVQQLAESLLAFRHLVQETQRQNGEDAFLDGNIPSDLRQWLRSELSKIEATALAEDCFWPQALKNLAAES